MNDDEKRSSTYLNKRHVFPTALSPIWGACSRETVGMTHSLCRQGQNSRAIDINTNQKHLKLHVKITSVRHLFVPLTDADKGPSEDFIGDAS